MSSIDYSASEHAARASALLEALEEAEAIRERSVEDFPMDFVVELAIAHALAGLAMQMTAE